MPTRHCGIPPRLPAGPRPRPRTHASLYPTVSLGGSASRNAIAANAPQVARQRNATSGRSWFLLNISWEPGSSGGPFAARSSPPRPAHRPPRRVASTRLSLQGLLAVTYLQLRGLDLQAQLLRSTIDAYTQTLDLTQVHLKGGLSTESDVARHRRSSKRRARSLSTSASSARSTSTPSPSSSASPQPPSTSPSSRSPAVRPPSPPAFPPSCSNAVQTSPPRSAASPPPMRSSASPSPRTTPTSRWSRRAAWTPLWSAAYSAPAAPSGTPALG